MNMQSTSLRSQLVTETTLEALRLNFYAIITCAIMQTTYRSCCGRVPFSRVLFGTIIRLNTCTLVYHMYRSLMHKGPFFILVCFGGRVAGILCRVGPIKMLRFDRNLIHTDPVIPPFPTPVNADDYWG